MNFIYIFNDWLSYVTWSIYNSTVCHLLKQDLSKTYVTYMKGEWVRYCRYCFWAIDKVSVQLLLFNIIISTGKLLITLWPDIQFVWGLHWSVACLSCQKVVSRTHHVTHFPWACHIWKKKKKYSLQKWSKNFKRGDPK